MVTTRQQQYTKEEQGRWEGGVELSKERRAFQMAFHCIGLASFNAAYALLGRMSEVLKVGLGWHFQYLTIWGLTLSTVTILLATVNDIFPNRVLAKVKDTMLAAAVPMEGLISLMYWGIVMYDRSLIWDSSMGDISFLEDASLHIIPMVVVWVDFLLMSPSFQISAAHPATIVGVGSLYGWWVEQCFHQNGVWAYPMLAQMNPMPRVGFYVGAIALCLGIYNLGGRMYGVVNSLDAPALKKKQT